MDKERLFNFLIEDLEKVEHHIQELIENVIARGQRENFKEDIDKIEMFFSYWEQHINDLNK